MTKQNHKNKQLGGPRKHWAVTQLFWFLVSCFLDPLLIWQMDGDPPQDREEISCSPVCVDCGELLRGVDKLYA